MATKSYGDSFDPSREQIFTRAACAELLIDAGAVVAPSVCDGLIASLCAGSDEAIAYRRRDDCACIDQELCTCRAREYLLPGRVEAVAVGLGSHPEQPALVFIRPPRQ